MLVIWYLCSEVKWRVWGLFYKSVQYNSNSGLFRCAQYFSEVHKDLFLPLSEHICLQEAGIAKGHVQPQVTLISPDVT